MSIEVQQLEREFRNQIERFRGALEEAATKKDDRRREALKRCDYLSQSARNTHEALTLELRDVPEAERNAVRGRIQELMAEYRNLYTDLEWKKNELTKEQVQAGAGLGLQQAEEDEEQVLTQQGDEVIKKGNEAIGRMQQAVEGMKGQKDAIIKEMNRQTDQLGKVGEGMDNLDMSIARARKQLTNISRHAANDRCIQILCAMICLAIVAMIVMAIVGADDNQLNVPTQIRTTDAGSSSRLLRGLVDHL
eukprot:GDKH01010837.1.p1 GENE.GDKH01010837.1~~GDKH01010837.1.p1  ORF type:complete len:249 (-),score=22.32 GDKH01010837.1:61-807(-)